MTTSDDPDMTPAELALGVLDGDERAAALRRVLAEPAFAREVEWWRVRLAALFAEWPAEDPAPAMAHRVAAIPDAKTGASAIWRWAAAASSIAAAILLAVLILQPSSRPPAPAPQIVAAAPLVAVIKPEKGEPFGAIFDIAAREVRLNGTVVVPADRVAELWAIGGDGVPHALGLLQPGRAGRLSLSSGAAIAEGTTLAISIEPRGGSPKPVPTGPVVASGRLAAI